MLDDKAATKMSLARASADLVGVKMHEMQNTMLAVCCLSAWHRCTYLGKLQHATFRFIVFLS